MSKSIRISTVTRLTFLVLLGLLLLTPVVNGFILIVFVPVVGWLLWRDQDRIAELEKRLAAQEKPASAPSKSDGA